MELRWTSLQWGALCHRSYFVRLLNPFLLPLLTPPAAVFYLFGAAAALVQTRAFFPFALLAFLFLRFNKMDWKIAAGSLVFSGVSLFYHLYVVSHGVEATPIITPTVLADAGLVCAP